MKTGIVSFSFYCATGILLWIATLSCVEAVNLTFDEKTNPLEGWSGKKDGFIISAGAGIDGTSAIVTDGSLESAGAIVFNPLDLPGFHGNTSIVEVKFKVRYVDAPDSADTGIAVVQFGFNEGVTNLGAVRFGFRADGTMTYSNGASSSILLKKVRLSDNTTWSAIAALLNYQTKEYTLFVDGVQRGGAYMFQGDGNLSDKIAIRIQNAGTGTGRSIALDDISVVVQTP